MCVSPAGSYFALSLFDRMWHPQLTEDEAIAMMEVRRGCEGLAGAGVSIRPAVGVKRGGTGRLSVFCSICADCIRHKVSLTACAAPARHVQAGIAEVKKRLVVAPPHYVMKVVDKNGVREVKKV